VLTSAQVAEWIAYCSLEDKALLADNLGAQALAKLNARRK
jgi:hypothetical protein